MVKKIANAHHMNRIYVWMFPSLLKKIVVQRVVVGFWRIYKTGKKERNSMLKTQKPAAFKFVHSKVKWEVFHR